MAPPAGEQVELFCISKLINCLLDADEEFVYMDCHFAVGACSLLQHKADDLADAC